MMTNVLALKNKSRTFFGKIDFTNPMTIRLITGLIVVGLLLVLPAGVALAQGGGGAIVDSFSTVVTTITEIIQGLAVVIGILGLSIWGLAKIARPVFPELSNLTNQYIGGLVVGVVVVFLAATVVQALADAVAV